MPYRDATAQDVAFFEEHGWIVVENAIDPADLEELKTRCDEVLKNKETMAFDWAWETGTPIEKRAFKIVQANLTRHWPALTEAPFSQWAVRFGSVLMRNQLEFWYDQFLAKPPGNKTPTSWHQDEGYWGRNLNNRGITCWMPFHDVDERNGCMHFIDSGHRDGVLHHQQPVNMQSDLLFCEPDEARTVPCPIKLGSVTFHHGKTPHMTPSNDTNEWRNILTQHMKVVGTKGEGDHYPWKVYVNQFTGERVVPKSALRKR